MSTTELRALSPEPEQVKLIDGTVVTIEDLRLRQFFKMLRIITRGSMPLLSDPNFFKVDTGDEDAFAKKLLTILVLSMPDAEDETVKFVRSMVKPYGLIERPGLNKSDRERNDELTARVDAALANPELEDTVSIMEKVVRREAKDMVALGKRLAAMFKLAEKTGQLSPTPASTPTTSDRSPASSTSSALSTDGPTTSSSTSPSSASISFSPSSENDASTSGGSESSG